MSLPSSDAPRLVVLRIQPWGMLCPLRRRDRLRVRASASPMAEFKNDRRPPAMTSGVTILACPLY